MSQNHIFRLEMPDGQGIFQNIDKTPSIWERCSDGYKNIKKHPTLAFDRELQEVESQLGFKMKEYYFGFESINQYYKWMFNPLWRERFFNEGVQLNEYEVEEGFLFRSDYQVIFKKEFSTLINSYAPNIDIKDLVIHEF